MPVELMPLFIAANAILSAILMVAAIVVQRRNKARANIS
jgi:energy-converting hydrogenase Eha subunit E